MRGPRSPCSALGHARDKNHRKGYVFNRQLMSMGPNEARRLDGDDQPQDELEANVSDALLHLAFWKRHLLA